MVVISVNSGDFMHELLSLQCFINNCDGPADITSAVAEDTDTIDFEDGLDKKETAFIEIFDYNTALCAKIPLTLSAVEKIELERLCRNRMSKKVIENEIINKKSKFFSKVDKVILCPGNSVNDRFTADKRHVVTISSNYSWNGEVINIHTAITVNTISNYSLPNLQQLLSSLSI
uniref:Uncharacterized protein n=1 Tax=Vannella robusta TaxID=1487602 RepID=A0A7S4ILN4_9EUKA|mmetsp:Transcript_4717/g.5738  ORF Transcript_4717/g.5738 Transcript_4717/m.5738 type:complete len:174 (+) Transcript_4717:3-524(+)